MRDMKKMLLGKIDNFKNLVCFLTLTISLFVFPVFAFESEGGANLGLVAEGELKDCGQSVFSTGDTDDIDVVRGSHSAVAILVPSVGAWNMEQHDETNGYFQAMHRSFSKFGVRLEVFKDWHNPVVIKDYVHYRLDKACNSGFIKDQTLIDRTRKAKMLLHAAVPDQVHSDVESGWRADHRILAAQALAFKIIDYKKAGVSVYVVGLGFGGGQIVAGASRLLSTLPIKTKSFAGFAGGLASALDGVAPLFGPYSIFITWGSKAVKFASRAAEILKNDEYLWQVSQMPVSFYAEYAFYKKKRPKFLIDKMYMLGVPVGKSHFAPDPDVIKQLYNLYSKGDLKCALLGGRKVGGKETFKGDVVDLEVKFDGKVLSTPLHLQMTNSKTLAAAVPYIHERMENVEDFRFGVPGKIIVSKNRPPKYVQKNLKN